MARATARWPATVWGELLAGAHINPARDLGPLVGGVIGALVYDLFVGDVLRARGAPPAPDVEAFGETVEERPAGGDSGPGSP